MINFTSLDAYIYLTNKFPDLAVYFKNGALDMTTEKSLGIFYGSETRATDNIAIGGVDCNSVRLTPINLVIRWTQDQKEHDNLAFMMFDTLLSETCNFSVGNKVVAHIQMLDGMPVNRNRDNKNVCESTIRLNFIYYVEEVAQ